MGKRIKERMDDLGTAFADERYEMRTAAEMLAWERERKANERTALDGYPAIADAVSAGADIERALICVNCDRTARGIIAGVGCEADGGEHVWTLESPADAPKAKARLTADADIDAWIERLDQRAYQDARADGYQAAIAAIGRGLAKTHPGIERIDKWAARLAYIGESDNA